MTFSCHPYLALLTACLLRPTAQLASYIALEAVHGQGIRTPRSGLRCSQLGRKPHVGAREELPCELQAIDNP